MNSYEAQLYLIELHLKVMTLSQFSICAENYKEGKTHSPTTPCDLENFLD